MKHFPRRIEINTRSREQDYNSAILAGIIITAIGIGMGLFGPERIYYNRYTGPNLLQFIQIYPHLTAAFGAALSYGFKLLKNRSIKNYYRDFADEIFQYTELQSDDIPDNHILVAQEMNDGAYLIGIYDRHDIDAEVLETAKHNLVIEPRGSVLPAIIDRSHQF